MIYRFFRSALFLQEAESAHRSSLALLALLPSAKDARSEPQELRQNIAGLSFPNPVGLAPGYDKNAEIAANAFGLGFGFVEIGTVTPLPQRGNPKPRLFRLVEDEAVINRMGFNNDGQAIVAERLTKLRKSRLAGPLGVNIGANKDSIDRIADYEIGIRNMEQFADYLTVNISSPNTPGLRALQDKGALGELLACVTQARKYQTPIFLKVAPDLDPTDIDDIVEMTLKHKIDALIVSNTTISRPDLRSRFANETGGLSGAPLRDLAQQRLRDFREASSGEITLIGVGGISSAADAYARIRAGASLVQLYSALVFEGPMLAKQINKGLLQLLKRDGFQNIREAIGVDS